jgi:hypothetical protein
MQSISSSIFYNDIEYSLDGFEQFSILSKKDNFTHLDVANSPLWKKEVNGTLFLIVKDEFDQIEHVSILGGGDNRTDIVAVPSNHSQSNQEALYAMISITDYDNDKINSMTKNHKDAFKYYDNQFAKTADTTFKQSIQKSSDHCSSFKIIDVAIAYDSTLCEKFGYNKQSADRHVQAIVGLASNFYEPMCLKLEISYMEGYCDTSTDPYQKMVRSKSILELFTASWRSYRQTVRRDVAHLLTGNNFENGILGTSFFSSSSNLCCFSQLT